jgi:hypothetical protein
MVDDRSGQNNQRDSVQTGIARPIRKASRLGDRIFDLFMRNPLAWFLFALLALAEYWNYQHLKQLDTVCQVIEIPDLLPDKPQTDLERAQWICEGRQEVPDMLEE